MAKDTEGIKSVRNGLCSPLYCNDSELHNVGTCLQLSTYLNNESYQITKHSIRFLLCVW